MQIYQLNISKYDQLLNLYTCISVTFTFQNNSQYPAEILCQDQLIFCQMLFQNKNQSLVFQSNFLTYSFSTNLPIPNAYPTILYQKYFSDGCVNLTGTNFFINQIHIRKSSSANLIKNLQCQIQRQNLHHEMSVTTTN